jgi:hypothetical protein
MDGAFERAIEGVYGAFQARVPLRIEACPCCRDPDDYRPPPAKPLRELTSSDLGSYTFFSVADGRLRAGCPLFSAANT